MHDKIYLVMNMTEFRHKIINLFIIILPILSLIIKLSLFDVNINFNSVKIIISLYLLLYVIFKSNSKFKQYNKYILLMGFFCLLYMKVNLNSMKLIYIKEYIMYILNFLFFPFALINLFCVYDDAGTSKDEINGLLFVNAILFCVIGLIFKEYILINGIELSLIYIILYNVVLNRFKSSTKNFVITSLIIYSFSLVGTINVFISFIVLGLLNVIRSKSKSSVSIFLITLLFVIINYDNANNYYLNYKVSLLNIVTMAVPIILMLTTLIYGVKTSKIKINITMVSLITTLLLLFISMINAPLLQNLDMLSIYLIYTFILLANEIKLLEKENIKNNKVTLIAPLNFGVNIEDDFVELANYLGKKHKITVVFPYERNIPFKSKNITILYLSNNKRFVKEKLRKFVMYDDSKVLLSFDNETNKIINDYGLRDSIKIAFKQGEYVSLAYSKFLIKRLKNIKIIICIFKARCFNF